MSALAVVAPPVEAPADLPWETERRLVRLNQRYVQCLDAKRLADWPGFFAPQGLYRIYPRENLEAGLPACLLYLEGRAMMRDRVLCLTQVSLYADVAVRHFLGAPAIRAEGGGLYSMTTNVLVVHSDAEGHSSIFCAGEYRDRIAEREGTLVFLEKTVVVDTFTIPSHLSYPL
ncbi:MAG: nuclear transport factor 2 family protein [Rhodospirillaceae bacterium]|nr:nuclear transport factor 2 family protein [Rhodospirillaceae bacterium]